MQKVLSENLENYREKNVHRETERKYGGEILGCRMGAEKHGENLPREQGLQPPGQIKSADKNMDLAGCHQKI